VVTLSDLQHAVDAAFATTSTGLDPWPDPHPDRSPFDEEYSRVLDPRKWRIVPARAEAWCEALVQLGLATLERDVSVRWATDRDHRYARIDRLSPRLASGIPVAVAYLGFEGVDINGVTIAAGEPAIEVGAVPPCGCDACDSGSQEALDLVDEFMSVVVSGRFRHLSDGERTIAVNRMNGWGAAGEFADEEIGDVLAHPIGWHEVSGRSWLGN
jgi:hypothetical protein